MPPLASTATVYSVNIYRTARRISAPGVAGIIAAHVGVVALLAMFGVAPLPAPPATLMVQMIRSAPPPAPEVVPPRPKPVERTPAPRTKAVQPVQPQILAASAEAPTAVAEAPVFKEAPPAPAPSAPAVSQPRFDAGYLQNPAPAYPALSRRMGEEGRVVLRVFVEPTGRPGQVEVKTGSGSSRLDQAAQEAVWRWKFVSARRSDEAIGAWVLVPIVFNLRG